MTGVIAEYPAAPAVNSVTQFQPIPGIAIDILNPIEKAPVPPPVVLGDSASIFYKGPFVDAGPYHVQYSTGEKYEGMIVELRHLTVAPYFNVGGRPQFGMLDNFNNQIGTYDISRWFTLPAIRWRRRVERYKLYMAETSGNVRDRYHPGLVMQVSGGAPTEDI